MMRIGVKTRLVIFFSLLLGAQQTCVYLRSEVIGRDRVPAVPEAYRVLQKSDDDEVFEYLSVEGQDAMRPINASWDEWSAQDLADYLAINEAIVESIDWYRLGFRQPNDGASRILVAETFQDKLPKAQPLFNLMSFGLVRAWNEGPSPQTAEALGRSLLISDLFWENTTLLNYMCGFSADLDMAWVILEQPPHSSWACVAQDLSQRSLEKGFRQAMYSEIPATFHNYDTLYQQPQGRLTLWLNRCFGIYNRHLTKERAYRRFEHLVNATSGPLDRFEPIKLKKPSPLQINFLGVSILTYGDSLYEPFLYRYGFACTLRDALRIWVALAENDLPWDAFQVSNLLREFHLLNPFDGEPYTVDGKGRLQLLPPDDARWEDILGRKPSPYFPTSRLVPPIYPSADESSER